MVPVVRTPAILLSALLLLSLALPAQAGSAAAPEVTDPSDDQAAAGTVPIIQPPAGTTVGLNVDILAAWIEAAGDHLQLSIQVQGPGSATATSSYLYTFHFETGGQAYDATGLLDVASPAGTGGITPGGAATTAVAAGDSLIILGVPLSGIGDPAPGAVLTNLFVTAEGKFGGKASGSITDRAPDDGAGADFTLAAPGGDAGPVYTTLTNSTVAIAQAFTNATTRLYVYNWTQGPASASIHLAARGSGNLTVQVKDGANATVFQSRLATIDTTANLTVKPGRWTLTLNYTQFKGNVTLSVKPWTPPPTSTPSSSSTSRNTTATPTPSTSTTKGTPGLGWPLAVAGLGAALAARRRRPA
jgi:MYXO-CTERM domain-containing protein